MKRIILIGLLSTVLGASADYQSTMNRRAEDAAVYHEYRAKHEAKIFKRRAKLSRINRKKARSNSKAHTAWSQSDAALFGHEMDMYKSGIRTNSYSWEGRESAKTGVTYNGGQG